MSRATFTHCCVAQDLFDIVSVPRDGPKRAPAKPLRSKRSADAMAEGEVGFPMLSRPRMSLALPAGERPLRQHKNDAVDAVLSPSKMTPKVILSHTSSCMALYLHRWFSLRGLLNLLDCCDKLQQHAWWHHLHMQHYKNLCMREGDLAAAMQGMHCLQFSGPPHAARCAT